MKLNIPKHISQLRIKHLKAFDIIKENEVISISDKIKLISIITDVSENKLRNTNVKGLQKAYSKVLELMNTYKEKEVPLELTYKGVTYELVNEFKKLPIGWFIDSSNVDFEKQPEYFPAFCYLEKGMDYASKDKHGNILNPLSERIKVFNKHLPLDTYLSLSGFFLRKYNQYKNSYRLIQEAKESLRNKKNSSGRV